MLPNTVRSWRIPTGPGVPACLPPASVLVPWDESLEALDLGWFSWENHGNCGSHTFLFTNRWCSHQKIVVTEIDLADYLNMGSGLRWWNCLCQWFMVIGTILESDSWAHEPRFWADYTLYILCYIVFHCPVFAWRCFTICNLSSIKAYESMVSASLLGTMFLSYHGRPIVGPLVVRWCVFRGGRQPSEGLWLHGELVPWRRPSRPREATATALHGIILHQLQPSHQEGTCRHLVSAEQYQTAIPGGSLQHGRKNSLKGLVDHGFHGWNFWMVRRSRNSSSSVVVVVVVVVVVACAFLRPKPGQKLWNAPWQPKFWAGLGWRYQSVWFVNRVNIFLSRWYCRMMPSWLGGHCWVVIADDILKH